jgi:hypothetical protein
MNSVHDGRGWKRRRRTNGDNSSLSCSLCDPILFEQVRCTKEGLTTDDGNNKLEEKVVQSTNSSFLCHFNFCFFSRGIYGHPEEASSR